MGYLFSSEWAREIEVKKERERENSRGERERGEVWDFRGKVTWRENNPLYCRFLSCLCEEVRNWFALISGGNQIQ